MRWVALFIMLIYNNQDIIAQLVKSRIGEANQERIKRSDCFFGFHFDFHATKNDSCLGRDFTPELLDSFLRATKPDYVQIDSKGHPGYSSYPTKVGYSNHSFEKDPMQIWSDVVHKYNIPLYVHYSGIWDELAIRKNPSWGRLDKYHSIDSVKAAFLGSYTDKLLIPQIKEMIENYSIDGAWIDGDCWASKPDYSPDVVNEFLRESGLDSVPKGEKETGYKQWLDYNREVFKSYVKKYVDEIHAFKPGFQISSNWLYSSMMPEQAEINVDFLSGDISARDKVYNAAFQSRCLALQGKPWDLMAWGFVPIDFAGGVHVPRSLVQIEQEAAEIMAMGGGFQVYHQQNRDGSFRDINIDKMAKLAMFCRDRQDFCQHANVIPQIGVWYSLEGWKQKANSLYDWVPHNMESICSLLLDGQYSTEVLMDHQLNESIDKYPLIVIPEWTAFEPRLKQKVMEYVSNGGSLLLIGAKTTFEFGQFLAVDFMGDYSDTQLNIGDQKIGDIAGIKTKWQPVLPKAGTETIGKVYEQCDFRYSTDYPVATVSNYGKGKIGAIYLDLSVPYFKAQTPVYKKLTDLIIKKLFPNPLVETKPSEYMHIVAGQKEDMLIVHLINTSGAHFNENVYAYDEILPTSPFSLVININRKPNTIKLQPQNMKLKYKYKDGKVYLTIPSFGIHTMVVVN